MTAPLSITRIVNACALITIGDEAVLTDPYFEERWFIRMREPIGMTAAELPKLAAIITESAFTQVTNGRFKGGYTTRDCGQPSKDVHAIQLELAMRAYMDEPASPSPDNWPSRYDPSRAEPLRQVLRRILETCLEFASQP